MYQWLLISGISIIAIMFITWVFYLFTRNPGIIDMVWSIAISTVGLIALFTTPMSIVQWFFSLLLLIWGIRLASYLFFTRVLPGHIDKRYETLSQDWRGTKALGFALNYQFQGLLAWLIACPFWWLRSIDNWHWNVILAIILVVVGIMGETLADYQLHRFKQHKKGICQEGLWRYSRHPNYFFEWLIWLGFAFGAVSADWGVVAYLSPLLLLYLMLFITGPMTENQSLKSHGDDFAAYQKKTSMFFPRPRKKD